MKETGIIELEGMEFHAHHGCLETEKSMGNLFVVDFKGKLNLGKAATSDSLEGTVDYSLIYDEIASQMAEPSQLLEHVASRIVKALESKFPEFESFSVRVSKQRPPVNGICRWSRVTLEK